MIPGFMVLMFWARGKGLGLEGMGPRPATWTFVAALGRRPYM